MAGLERLETLGQGSFGAAILARVDGGLVVLKEIRLSGMTPAERADAEQEALILQHVQHPNIVMYLGSWISGSTLSIAMEYCSTGDLFDYLEKRRHPRRADTVDLGGADPKPLYLTEAQIIGMFAQQLLAIGFLHSQRILHRDLKSKNVFLAGAVCARGCDVQLVKIGDFGIAKVLSGTAMLAHTQIGTPYYMPPEICQDKPYGDKADVWSLGCLLYEMTALEVPYNGRDLSRLALSILRDPPPKLRSEHAHNPQLGGLISVLLQKNPDFRPSVAQVCKMPYMMDEVTYWQSALRAMPAPLPLTPPTSEAVKPVQPPAPAQRAPPKRRKLPIPPTRVRRTQSAGAVEPQHPPPQQQQPARSRHSVAYDHPPPSSASPPDALIWMPSHPAQSLHPTPTPPPAVRDTPPPPHAAHMSQCVGPTPSPVYGEDEGELTPAQRARLRKLEAKQRENAARESELERARRELHPMRTVTGGVGVGAGATVAVDSATVVRRSCPDVYLAGPPLRETPPPHHHHSRSLHPHPSEPHPHGPGAAGDGAEPLTPAEEAKRRKEERLRREQLAHMKALEDARIQAFRERQDLEARSRGSVGSIDSPNLPPSSGQPPRRSGSAPTTAAHPSPPRVHGRSSAPQPAQQHPARRATSDRLNVHPHPHARVDDFAHQPAHEHPQPRRAASADDEAWRLQQLEAARIEAYHDRRALEARRLQEQAQAQAEAEGRRRESGAIRSYPAETYSAGSAAPQHHHQPHSRGAEPRQIAADAESARLRELEAARIEAFRDRQALEARRQRAEAERHAAVEAQYARAIPSEVEAGRGGGEGHPAEARHRAAATEEAQRLQLLEQARIEAFRDRQALEARHCQSQPHAATTAAPRRQSESDARLDRAGRAGMLGGPRHSTGALAVDRETEVGGWHAESDRHLREIQPEREQNSTGISSDPAGLTNAERVRERKLERQRQEQAKKEREIREAHRQAHLERVRLKKKVSKQKDGAKQKKKSTQQPQQLQPEPPTVTTVPSVHVEPKEDAGGSGGDSAGREEADEVIDMGKTRTLRRSDVEDLGLQADLLAADVAHFTATLVVNQRTSIRSQ